MQPATIGAFVRICQLKQTPQAPGNIRMDTVHLLVVQATLKGMTYPAWPRSACMDMYEFLSNAPKI